MTAHPATHRHDHGVALTTTPGRVRVVILGGGFGGLAAARALRRAPVDVVLVDRRNHHLFQPLLYQVATAGLSPGDIAAPIRWVLRAQRNVQVLLGEAVRIDTAARIVHLDIGTMGYDYLIVATGATHAYFGHDEWQASAPGLKTLDDAGLIRRRLLLAFEHAERTTDLELRRRLLTFVVVGAGPTGVELAGAIAELARFALVRDFRTIDPRTATVLLVEAGPSVLSTFPVDLQARAVESLTRLGVVVRTNVAVTLVDEDGVTLATGERVAAGSVLWAAGVAASPLGAALGVPLDRNGRVRVNADLSVPGAPDAFVIGDLARFEQDGEVVPGVAPAALQQGTHAAENIRRRMTNQPARAFVYRNYGNMATIGRASAIADFGRYRFSGLVGWLLWLFVHIMQLTGFRNRLAVLMEWAWAYVTHQRGIRLITGRTGEVTLPVSADVPGPPSSSSLPR
jgi:NADH:ubiquinone reductase (H+-translocating)